MPATLTDTSWQLLFDRSPVPAWVFDVETLAFLAVNDAAVLHYGWTRAEFLAMGLAEIRPPEDRATLAARAAATAGAGRRRHEARHWTRGGRVIDVQVSSDAIEFAGRAARLVTVEDVSDRRRAERALLSSQRRFATLAMHAPVGLFEADATGRCTFVNAWVGAVTGRSPADIIGEGWDAMLHAEDRAAFAARWHACLASGERFVMEYRLAAADGGARWVLGTADVLRDAQGALAGAIGSLTDIGDRKVAEDALRESATRDALTGLLNRRGFLEFAEPLLAASAHRSPCVLLYADMDGLKQINDVHGHAAGDEALAEVGRLLRDTLRTADVIARLGGDEFTALMPRMAAEHVPTLQARLDGALARHHAQSRRPWPLALSIGTAAFDPHAPRSLQELMREADAALYAQKLARRR